MLSAVGNAMFAVNIASYFYSARQSSSEVGIAIAMNWLPGVLLLLVGGHWADRYSSRKLWIISEISAVGVRLLALTFLSLGLEQGLLALLFLDGITAAVGRVVRTSSVAKLVSEERKGSLATWIQTLLYIGYGLAGLISAKILTNGNVTDTTLIAAFLSLGAALIISFSKEVSNPNTTEEAQASVGHSVIHSFGLIRRDDHLFLSIGALIAMGIFFQGSYTFFETIIPIQSYGLGQSGVGYAYAISSFAIIVGALLYQSINRNKDWNKIALQTFKVKLVLLSLAACVLYLALTFATSAALAGVLFFAFVALYEYCFFLCYAKFVSASPSKDLGKLSAFLHAIAPLGQGIIALALGVLFAKLPNFTVVVILLLSTFSISLACLIWRSK